MTKQTGRKTLLIAFYAVALSLLLLTLISCQDEVVDRKRGEAEAATWEARATRSVATYGAATQEAATAIADVETYEARAEARATSEAEATAAAQAGDICSLLPVDVSVIIADQTVREPGYGGFCTASIQYLVGGDASRSIVGIVKYQSETEARETFQYPSSCGHADWLPAPIGDAGYGYSCPDVDEEYREGVAQAYYSIWFLQGPYTVQIRSSYPGQRDTILDIGRQIIDNINRLPGS